MSEEEMRSNESRIWKVGRILIIGILIIALLYGGYEYFSLQQRSNQKLQEYLVILNEKDIVYLERSLTNLDKINATKPSSFGNFSYLVEKENISQLYLDKAERVLYFWDPSTDARTGIVGFYYERSFAFDWGALWTLGLTGLILLVCKFDKWVYERLKTCARERRLIILILVAIGLIGIWLTVRATTLYLRQNLLVEGFSYLSSDIFQILSFLVTANLSFTLVRALWINDKGTKSTEEESDNAIEGLADVIIQAIMVSLITLVPSYGNSEFLQRIGGPSNFVFILMAMTFAVLILVFVRQRLIRSS